MPKALLVSLSGDGCWFSFILEKEGWTVDTLISNDKYKTTLQGLIRPVVDSPGAPESYDLVVFDQTGLGALADSARSSVPVIGDSALSDKLEHDRIFGIETMQRAGIRVPDWEAFDDVADAIRWLRKTHKRAVFKPLGSADPECTYVSKSQEDMERYMEILFKRIKVKEFILQEFIPGTEVSTEAWFNGDDFYALNHTLEEKKFLAGGLGPNTGCAGNLVWMPPRPNPIYQRGLEKVKPLLVDVGYRGMLDLNSIVTDGELYGIEWTPRFGYEGTCNLIRLLPMPFGDFMGHIATGQPVTLAGPQARFAATVRLSVPPYPSGAKAKDEKFAHVPLTGIDLDRLDSFYLANARVVKGTETQLETIGSDLPIGAPVGLSETIKGAFNECQAAIDRLLIPDLQYRNDCCACVEKRFEKLTSGGWLRGLG